MTKQLKKYYDIEVIVGNNYVTAILLNKIEIDYSTYAELLNFIYGNDLTLFFAYDLPNINLITFDI